MDWFDGIDSVHSAYDPERPEMWQSEIVIREKVRCYNDVLKQRQSDERHPTTTTVEQDKVEADVLKLLKSNKRPVLNRTHHISLLRHSLKRLNDAYECLDCSRPWLCYWILHSLQILEEELKPDEAVGIIHFLNQCQSPDGGFGGGPGQRPHLAPTYAAVNALCIIGTTEAYNIINRQGLQKFLLSLRAEDGSFCMHIDGETDIRGVYCAIAVAELTNVGTSEMFERTDEWVASCQTYEGGFGGCPGMEAHGGYTFCGLAALVMLGKTDLCHIPSLLRWLVNKQMRLEGGFQGRTNKLVDGCYSFWQGGTFALLHAILEKQGKPVDANWLFNQGALQEYLIICCQNPFGGLIDKPGNNRDIYHTCYALSGLSIAQNTHRRITIGSDKDLVEPIHPVYNLVSSTAQDALKFFRSLRIPKQYDKLDKNS